MTKEYISSIQQIGVGTSEFRKHWDWLIRNLGFDVKILEDDTVAERMLPYTGGQPQKRHACIAVNLQGGGGLEIWQYSQRKPKEKSEPVRIGDLGIFAAKIKCRENKLLTKTSPDGKKCEYIKDPYGNIFQLVEDKSIYIEDKKITGGVVGAMVGVSDMDKSIAFYRDALGYDRIEYDVSGSFDDWEDTERYRRVLMSRSTPAKSAFSELLGDNKIELVQALGRSPARIYENRYWGDPGFIQICYDVIGMKGLEEELDKLGIHFTVDSCPDGEQFDMGEASGHFTYIEDPDGTLIEFVETHKVPIGKLFKIDMDKRKSNTPLPKILFRLMGLFQKQ